MPDLSDLLKLLIHSPVDFVLVGGFAAVLHGCNQTTRDLDICVLSSEEQVSLLKDVLKPYHPRHRMTEPKLSFLEDSCFSDKQDLYLTTDLGLLDVIHHIEGIGGYYDVLRNCEEIAMYGGQCRLISLEDLIRSKKSLGRHRDLTIIQELEAIQAERRNKSLKT